ncbi:hypothetical protein AWB93_06405 [Mycobacterium bohemicum]|uniref:Transmembrane protein n=2 Tax=Mycobacterium bohemicum TaxID=56425 RepID=A0A1X1RA54_MYCBE|nr:hypothetical protein AWB93_06405 [Mycobacterium bohemicum]
MLRGLAFAGAMIVVRLIQGALINAFQTQAGLISLVLLVLFIVGVVIWGSLDGRADARANPDPDRRQDLAMTWLLAGLLAGVLSGAVCWIIALFYQGLYTGGLINEVTTFAAFTALIVFVPAIIGVTVGRWRIDRTPEAQRRTADAEGERADTDVFTAVRGDDAPTGEIPAQSGAAQHEERTSAVATAERGEEPTETIATSEEDPKTEVIPTETPAHPESGSESESESGSGSEKG